MQPHYTIVRHPKSMGIALLLTFLLGPVGLFYSSVTGGLILCGIPLLIVLTTVWITISKIQALIFLLPFTYLYSVHIYATLLFIYFVAIVWAVLAVSSYNKALLAGSTIYHPVSSEVETSEVESTISDYTNEVSSSQDNIKNRYIYISIISILLVIVVYFTLDKYYFQRQEKQVSKTEQLTPLYSSPNIKSRIISILPSNRELYKLSETVYFIKVKIKDENGNMQTGFIRKHQPITDVKEDNSSDVKAFTENKIDEDQLVTRMGNLVKTTLESQISENPKYSPSPSINNKVLWIESVKDNSDYPCLKTVLNTKYLSQATEPEKATLAFIATFINTNCQYSKNLNQCAETELVKSVDEMVNSRTEDMYCGLLNALNLDYFGSQKHHKFLEEWFGNDFRLVKSIKESYSVSQNDASSGNRMSNISITTVGNKITLSYKGEVYSSRSSYEKAFKEQSVFEYGNHIKVISLGPVLKQLSSSSSGR